MTRNSADNFAVSDPRDIVEIGGTRVHGGEASSRANGAQKAAASARSRFLAVWFRCCHVYGRMQRNHAQTAYEGRCPRCGAKVHARIGPGGTSRRVFEAG